MDMNLKTPLLETANELFATLARIDTQRPLRTRYGILREVLTVAIDQQLANVTVKLSGPYAKIDYLIKLHQLRTTDRSLSFAINDTRVRLHNLCVTPDSELQQAWGIDFKAVSQFIALIYDAHIPPSLQKLFPLTSQRVLPQRVKDGVDKAVSYLRCSILRWDDTFIYATREDNDEQIRINYIASNTYIPGDRNYLKRIMVEGEKLNVIRPRIDKDGSLLPELIIYAPDYLINVTSVAGCFDSVGCSPWIDVLRRISPNQSTIPILLGNFAGQLLDETAYQQHTTYADSIRYFFKQNALNIATCAGLDASFHEQAQLQKQNIQHIMTHDYEAMTSKSFRSDEVILEPSFFSDALGLQGRMDFLDLSYRTIIEQKSGKCKWQKGAPADAYTGKQEAHYVQMLLYRALLHYDYLQLNADQMQAFLLYSRYHNGLDLTTSAPQLLFEAFKLRNLLASGEEWFTRGGLKQLETLTPERIFPHAEGNLWRNYKKTQIEALLAPIHQASALERAYYFRFLQFVANEQALSRIGNKTKENSGFASTWNSSVEDKREAGNIYENLHITIEENEENKITDVHLHFHQATTDADLSNFRIGDIVIFYPYAHGTMPDATATLVFRGTLTNIEPQELSIRLRNAQTSSTVFEHYKGKVWAIEHDFMDSAYNAQYRGLHAFLSAPQQRRDLLLGQQPPTINAQAKRLGDYGNEVFNNLVLHANQANDLYIIIGPPGTGKTSYGMKNLLTEELMHEGSNILLLSYTNRAVDEICSKLVEEHIDFIRLGNDFSCEERYRPYLLSERIEQMDMPNIQKVRNLVQSHRVFCGTTTSVNAAQALFKLKQFDLAIIDEASQILEPHLLPLLSATHLDECAIKRFVLIGDEKQLPAVVQQSSEESTVNDPQLNAIGLTDCRLSLFERLLHIYGYHADGTINESVCHLLTHQGRMHSDISYFPSHTFYDGKLQVVPLPHQVEPTPSVDATQTNIDWTLLALHYHRVFFVSCIPPDNPDEPDKVNSLEARLTAQLVKCAYNENASNFNALSTLGIIVPYRNQIATMRAAIAQLNIPVLHNITIDTVERYQGSQRDIIIYSFTAKHKYQLQFLTNNEYIDKRTGSIIDRKLNVAMTRARKHLVLLGNAPLLTADVTFKRLINFCKTKDAFVEM